MREETSKMVGYSDALHLKVGVCCFERSGDFWEHNF